MGLPLSLSLSLSLQNPLAEKVSYSNSLHVWEEHAHFCELKLLGPQRIVCEGSWLWETRRVAVETQSWILYVCTFVKDFISTLFENFPV